MKTKTYLLFSLITILFLSCHKKKIEEIPLSNEPVFKAEGTLNGANFSIIAGDNNAYMNSYSETINGVTKFTGKLSGEDIEIELGIFDGNIDSPFNLSQIQINSLDWAINSTEPLAVLSKNNFSNAYKISQIQWFSGNTLLGTDVAYITEPGIYDILAFVTFSDGTTASLRNELILGYTTNANYNLHFDLFPNGNLNAYIDINSGDIAGVTWLIDGYEVEGAINATSLSKNLDDNEGHEISATVLFTNGTLRTKSFYVDASLHGNNIPDFTTFEEETPNVQSIKQDFKSLLIFRQNNIEYRSDYPENTSGEIEIDTIEYYGLNDDGKKVYKITAEISTNLKNMASNVIIPVNFKTVFGIEIE